MFVVNKSSLNFIKVYECDDKVKELLVDMGLMPISSYEKDNKIVWLFVETNELLQALKEVGL